MFTLRADGKKENKPDATQFVIPQFFLKEYTLGGFSDFGD